MDKLRRWAQQYKCSKEGGNSGKTMISLDVHDNSIKDSGSLGKTTMLLLLLQCLWDDDEI